MPNEDKFLIKKYGSEDGNISGMAEREIRERDMDRKFNREKVRLLRQRCKVGVFGFGVDQDEWDRIFPPRKDEC